MLVLPALSATSPVGHCPPNDEINVKGDIWSTTSIHVPTGIDR